MRNEGDRHQYDPIRVCRKRNAYRDSRADEKGKDESCGDENGSVSRMLIVFKVTQM